WSNTWSAPLGECLYRCYNIALQVAHPAPHTITFHMINRIPICPLIKQIRKIDPGTYSNFYRGRKARIDLHQVGISSIVASKLDFGVAFQFDFTHQTFCLLANVLWNGNTLSQYRGAT